MATNTIKTSRSLDACDSATSPIYMDYAATTPVDERVAKKMMECLTRDGVFANPASSSHQPGRSAKGLVERARAQVAELASCEPTDLIWTSGATESDNLALKGVARAAGDNKRHIVTCKTEHKAVLDSCKQLEREGFKVTYLVPEKTGQVTPQQIEQALRPDTCLVSVMHVNNEIGVINDIASIGRLCRDKGVAFHVDAAQSAGKTPINLRDTAVDLMSFSAHKAYGPKGIGALYVNDRTRNACEPLIHGGGHERGLRSGTLATHQIVGMGEAFELADAMLASEHERLSGLRQRLLAGLAPLGGLHGNGDIDRCVPSIVNISFEGVEGESLLFAVRALAVSSGSACIASSEGSYVLRALGRSDQLAQSSIRFSLGRFSTEQDIDCAVEIVTREVRRLRELGAHDNPARCESVAT